MLDLSPFKGRSNRGISLTHWWDWSPQKFVRSKLYRRLLNDDPMLLVDVGARGGPQQPWRDFRDRIKMIGYEPDTEECARLRIDALVNETYEPIAISDHTGTLHLYITEYPSSITRYRPNGSETIRFANAHDNLRVINEIDVECDTLDHLLTGADFLKIDVEGGELQVLKGAQRLLSEHLLGAWIEAEFIELHHGQPMFEDINIFMRDAGYALFELDIHIAKRAGLGHMWTRGQPMYANALYLRDPVKDDWLPATLEKAIKAIAIADLYGHPDFAVEQVDWYERVGLLQAQVSIEIKALLEVRDPRPLVRLRGVGRLARLARRLFG